MAKFDLNKTGEKKFDLNKGNKRKFDLSKDDDELEVVTSTEEQGTPIPNGVEPKKKWPYIVGALIIIALVIWGLSKCGSEGQNETPEIKVPIVADTTQTTAADSVATVDTSATENTEEGVDAPNAEEQPAEQTKPDTTVPSQKEVSKAESSSAVSATSVPTVTNTPSKNSVSTTSSNIEQKALQVIRGDFGNGETRKNNLGSEYNAIQQRVNEMYKQGLVD